MSQFASLAHRNFSSILYGRNGKEVIEMSEKRATRVRNKYKYLKLPIAKMGFAP